MSHESTLLLILLEILIYKVKSILMSRGKESTEVRITQNKGKLLPKNEVISGGKAHTDTWKLI